MGKLQVLLGGVRKVKVWGTTENLQVRCREHALLRKHHALRLVQVEVLLVLR